MCLSACPLCHVRMRSASVAYACARAARGARRGPSAIRSTGAAWRRANGMTSVRTPSAARAASASPDRRSSFPSSSLLHSPAWSACSRGSADPGHEPRRSSRGWERVRSRSGSRQRPARAWLASPGWTCGRVAAGAPGGAPQQADGGVRRAAGERPSDIETRPVRRRVGRARSR